MNANQLQTHPSDYFPDFNETLGYLAEIFNASRTFNADSWRVHKGVALLVVGFALCARQRPLRF